MIECHTSCELFRQINKKCVHKNKLFLKMNNICREQFSTNLTVRAVRDCFSLFFSEEKNQKTFQSHFFVGVGAYDFFYLQSSQVGFFAMFIVLKVIFNPL